MTLTGKKEIDMWKPGQLVTIHKHVYRVTRTNNPFGVVHCDVICDMWSDDKPLYPVCAKEVCQKICFSYSRTMPDDCYLVRVKPKSSIG